MRCRGVERRNNDVRSFSKFSAKLRTFERARTPRQQYVSISISTQHASRQGNNTSASARLPRRGRLFGSLQPEAPVGHDLNDEVLVVDEQVAVVCRAPLKPVRRGIARQHVVRRQREDGPLGADALAEGKDRGPGAAEVPVVDDDGAAWSQPRVPFFLSEW